ncbi:ADP-ribosylation [Hypoxylon fragiforme]|uniref:ADP-ribosylation n=1 Tax=Hypoxylon fragiforme TaxID=63214 RepID=UPI0020C72E0F|nr:ADP-ribosylation [Hypoxylon fragiforme]KAI2607296.1 ADP-ribosylation [Hypoxylon fragiforme]
MTDSTELSEDDLVELSLLRGFETDELIKAGLLSEDQRLAAPLDREVVFKHDELDLHVTADSAYPARSVEWRIENRSMSRKVVDELRMKLRQIVQTSSATNNISRWKRRDEDSSTMGVFEPVMVVLELARETVAHVKMWREILASREKVKPPDPRKALPFKEKPANAIITSSDIAFHYLRKTPQQICSQIPPEYRILHVEEILRKDLVRRFHKKQEAMAEKLEKQSYYSLRKCVPPAHHGKRKEAFVEYLTKPHVTFHGTARQFVPSIVRHGFLKPGKPIPGTGEAHQIRCGSTYGQGIYTSPNPDFSLNYTGYRCHATNPNEYFGIKLIVCATLMGRTAQVSREDNWRDQTEPYPGSESHVANRNLEYIVFDSAQVLPVYVIHIDWGQDNLLHFKNIPRDPTEFVPETQKTHHRLVEEVRWPGDVQREKAASLARAAKYFPYGYGPATGGRFVVEEIGEVDEDDEEYGDYQALRGEEIKDKSNLDFWSWVKVAEEMDAAGADGELPPDEYTIQKMWYGPKMAQTEEWNRIPDPRKNNDDDNGDGQEEDDGDLGLDLLMIQGESSVA